MLLHITPKDTTRHKAVALDFDPDSDQLAIVRMTGLGPSAENDEVIPVEGSGREYLQRLTATLTAIAFKDSVANSP